VTMTSAPEPAVHISPEGAPPPGGRLLLVIPSILDAAQGEVRLDEHFANNLAAYLENFRQVTVACPSQPQGVNSIPLSRLPGADRCRIVVLPTPYREDRYLLQRRRVSRLLSREIQQADYLLISPHAAFDWSTRAAQLAVEMKRDFDMEADANLQDIMRSLCASMPAGLNKLRKYLWLRLHSRAYLSVLKHSRVALLQGATVFDAYRDVAPNPHKVLNVQITNEDRIGQAALDAKVRAVLAGDPLRIVYTGRAIDIKGPFEWIEALARLQQSGTRFQADWYGDGELLSRMRQAVAVAGLASHVTLHGNVERSRSIAALRDAHICLFCHQTEESPRCLLEAIASGAALVGYSSRYAQDLVESGGGLFTGRGNVGALTDTLLRIDADRRLLGELMHSAFRSSLSYDRHSAIHERIELIKKYVRPPSLGLTAEQT